jgi:hypothetical protein
MSKTTRMLSAQSHSLVSQIECKLSRVLREIHFSGKMKAGHLFPMMGILFLLSLLLVACQIGGGNTTSSSPPQAVASATPQTVAPGTTPVVTPGTKPVTPGTKPVTPGTKPVTPGTKPVAPGTKPVTPGTKPVTPGTKPVAPGAKPVAPGTKPVTPGTKPVAPGTKPGPDPNSPVVSANGMSFNGSVKSSPNSSSSLSSSLLMSALSVNSIVVSMPDGNTLSMNVTSQTDLSDFDGDLPEVGDRVKVEAIANADGSFTAAKLSHEQPNDPDINVITYQGVTTSAVGADDVIHFKVGLKSYSFTIPSSADLEDFNGNAQAIQANQVVNVKVEFNESEGTLLKVGKASPLEQSPQQ